MGRQRRRHRENARWGWRSRLEGCTCEPRDAEGPAALTATPPARPLLQAPKLMSPPARPGHFLYLLVMVTITWHCHYRQGSTSPMRPRVFQGRGRGHKQIFGVRTYLRTVAVHPQSKPKP